MLKKAAQNCTVSKQASYVVCKLSALKSRSEQMLRSSRTTCTSNVDQTGGLNALQQHCTGSDGK